LLISAAIFLALPETANAQVWVSSGFKAGSDAQHETAYCSTSAIDPATGKVSPAATDYIGFQAGCVVSGSDGSSYTNSDANCNAFSTGSWISSNPSAQCNIEFAITAGVSYVINAFHLVYFIEENKVLFASITLCNKIVQDTNIISSVCTNGFIEIAAGWSDSAYFSAWLDPEGFISIPPVYTPIYTSSSSSITEKIVGTGISQYVPMFSMASYTDMCDIINNMSFNFCTSSSSDWIEGQAFVGSWFPAITSAQYTACSSPKITSISPSTWLAGSTYAITLTGTNFTTSANATTSCPATPLTVTTPSGTVVAVSNVAVASETQITATVAPPTGESTETATITVGTTPNTASATAEILPACNLPTTENTSFQGWDTAQSYPTIGNWEQTLSDSNGNVFSGYQVREIDAETGVDTCWFANPYSVLPMTGVTGTQWSIGDGNTWGPDQVGMYPSAVSFYRKNNRAPCGFTVYQQMQIQCADGSWQNYGPVNTLKGNLTTTTVTSVRAGGTATRRY
jgi:hypothetical protein